jgi:hypothetical protein
VARHRAQQEPDLPDLDHTVGLPSVPADRPQPAGVLAVPAQDADPADHGRISPWVIAIVAAAVALFVAGAGWAVIGPSRSAGTAPGVGPTGVVLGQAPVGEPPAGTPAPGSPSDTSHPSAGASGAPPTGSSGSSGSPARGGSSDPAPPPPTGPAATVSVSTWSPNGMKADIVITAGSGGMNGWQATVTCAGGLDPGSVNLWGASQVSAVQGAITVRNLDWNGSIAAGQTAEFGFTASWSGSGTQHCDVAVTAG